MGIDKETGIWDLETAKRRHRYDPKLSECISTTYKSAESIADIGCGTGEYCKYLKDHLQTPVIHGYEGTPNIEEIAVYNNIMNLDLTKKRWVDIYYPLILCLEVGEHIPKKYEEIVIDNICEFVCKDLVLSWAIPGQGGTGHYNEQPNDYIISEFVKRGMIYNESNTKKLRECSSLRWFKNTIMVFERGNNLDKEMYEFGKRLKNWSKSLDPKFAQLINERFWDIL